MHFGKAIEADLEAAVDPGKRKKPLSKTEIVRRRQMVFAKWFDEEPEKKFRDPAKR
jgi:hypothetical protein